MTTRNEPSEGGTKQGLLSVKDEPATHSTMAKSGWSRRVILSSLVIVVAFTMNLSNVVDLFSFQNQRQDTWVAAIPSSIKNAQWENEEGSRLNVTASRSGALQSSSNWSETNVENTGKNLTISWQGTKLMYIHVGKTGGTTLNQILKANCAWMQNPLSRRQCFGQLERVEPKVSQLTSMMVHVQRPSRKNLAAWLKETNAFLLTVRNPITRTISAFNMEHPLNTLKPGDFLDNIHHNLRTFYLDCFPTIEQMSKRLRQVNHTESSAADVACFELGKKTLAGQGHPFVASHLYFNYRFYADRTFGNYPSRPVFVARTERLWEDLSGIDRQLGGSGTFDATGSAQTHGSQTYKVKSGLSSEGKLIMCCYLVPELLLYENLIRRAVNLLPLQKEEALDKVYSDCGIRNATHILSIAKCLQQRQ